VRICPECQNRYDDDVDACPNDGEALVPLPDELSGNPKLQEVVQAQPGERTSMIDLEAIEAKRAARRAEAAGEDGEAGDGDEDDDKTPPPEEPVGDDDEATGTLQKARKKKTRTKIRSADEDAPPDDEIAPDRRVSNDPTNKDMSRRDMTKSGTHNRTRSKLDRSRITELKAGRTGTHAGTRGGTHAGTRTKVAPLEEADESSGMSGTKAAILALVIVGTLVGSIIVVSQLFAVLTVTTVPPGAEVVLDGEHIGQSPVQKRVRVDSHVIELEKPEYEPFKEVVQVPSDGLPFLQPLRKKPPPPPPPPTNAQIADEMVRIATALFEKGDLEAAKNKLEEAKKLAPNNAALLELLKKVDAEIAARAAAFENAAAAQSREERIRASRALTAEGTQKYNAGAMSEAREKLYKALKLDPSYPEPHRVLSRIYNRENDTAKVRYHLERYLQLGGSDSDFKVREWLKQHPK
jgi:hypothetical protein